MPPTVDEIVIADDPDAWRAAGFRVDDGACDVGTIRLRLAGRDAGAGLVGWSLRGIADGTGFDGLPTHHSNAPARDAADPHPNSTIAIDHVVAFTPDRARTVAALEAAGLNVRRLRDEPTPGGGGGQAFFRLGETILEVIEQPTLDGAARLWGLAFTAESLELCKKLLGHRLSEPRPAVQPEREIATVRRAAGLAIPVAFMTPGPGAG